MSDPAERAAERIATALFISDPGIEQALADTIRSEYAEALDRKVNEARHPGGCKIVCLCGSTRFAREFMAAQFQETIGGSIVLTVGCFPRKTDGSWDTMQVSEDQKIKLDELHLRKIDLADEVLVINVGGYVGESTAREIAYAKSIGKPIRYWEPIAELKAALGKN